MANEASQQIHNEMEQEMSQTPQGRAQLAAQKAQQNLAMQQQEMIANEMRSQEPFFQTPEQTKFLDYLNQQNYGGNQERDDYANMLSQRMKGQTGSLAEAQMAQNLNQNANIAMGATGSNRGVLNPALLAKQASGIYSSGNQQVGNAASMARAQETQGNVDLYGNELSTAQSQKLAQQKQFADTLDLERQANIDRARFITGIESENAKAQQEAANRENARNNQIIAGLGQGATTLLAANMRSGRAQSTGAPMNSSSDIRLKKDITNGEGTMNNYLDELASREPAGIRQRRLDDPITFGDGKGDPSAFLDSLTPYEYKYKNPRAKDAGSGQRLGIMAQDLEKTPQGKAMVKDTSGGKKINADVSTLLAAEALNHKRIQNLESEIARTKEQASTAIPSVNTPPSGTIPTVNMPPASSDKLTRSYYEGNEERLRVPPKEWPTYGLAPNTGEIVQRGQPYVEGTTRYMPTEVPPVVQPSPEDMKKVADYLDMVNNMESSKVPMPEKFKRARK